ncbi:MAG: hypothetical protein KIT87_18780 [Anaerolineae bacterium]|nr:hypothetical protein [Anaerolineae bacterium]
MPNTFQLALDKTAIELAPGGSDQVKITIKNRADRTEEVAFSVTGVDPSWVQLEHTTRMAPALDEADVRLTLRPPLTPTPALAGRYSIVIHGEATTSQGNADQQTLALTVRRRGDFRLQLGAATWSGVEEAAYPVHIVNDANAPLVIRLEGEAPNGQLWVKADPYRLTLPPGGEGDAVVTVRAPQAVTETRQVRFTVKAQGEYVLQGGLTEAALARSAAADFTQLPRPQLGLDLEPAEWRPPPATAETLPPAIPQFRLRLTNPGPDPVGIEWVGQGAAQGFQFSPPTLDLPPQGQGQASLVVQTPPLPSGEEKVFDFEVTTRILSGLAQPATHAGRVIQRGLPPPPPPPPPPPRWPWLALAVIVILAVCLLVGLLAVLWLNLGR